MAATLLWYDLETFGRNPAWDRIAQYAAVRTGANFEPIGEPTVLFCRASPEYLPEPEACLVTGLTPQRVKSQGLTEAEFADRVHREMSVPGTCVAGYNTVRFDDEFIRNLFYRNFYDPYRREYADGNSRWDIVDLVRMMHDLRPEGISWPEGEDGKPLFKLESISAANGLAHEKAHDALSDVYATIGLARLVHERQPKLFGFLFTLRKKDEVRKLLSLQSPAPLVHSSSLYTRPGACSSIVYPLSAHPDSANTVLVYDLRHDPRSWMELPPEEIRSRVFAQKDQIDESDRVRFVSVHLNRCPALAPLSTLSEKRALELGIDLAECLRNAERLRSQPGLVQKIREVYAGGHEQRRDPKDPDLQIYSGGFFGDEDRQTFEYVHQTEPQELISSPPSFRDARGAQLLWRYLARNYYEVLRAEDKSRWMSHCAARLLVPEIEDAMDFKRFRRKVENLLARSDTPASHKGLLLELREYADWIEAHVLSYQG